MLSHNNKRKYGEIIMRKVLSIFICFVIFIIYFVLEISLNFGLIFSKGNIKNINNNFSSTSNVNFSENFYWKDILTKIYDISSDYNIPKDKVNKVLESKDVKLFITNYINDIYTLVLNNNINKTNIEKYLKENINKYLENNNELNPSDKDNISKFISDNSDQIINNIMTITQITNNINPTILNFVQLFFSLNIRLIFVGIISVCIFLIILLQLKNNRWLLYLTNTIFFSALFNILFSIILKYFIITNINNSIVSIISLFSNSILKSYLLINIFGILISIGLFYIYNFFQNKKNLKLTINNYPS